MNTSIQDTALYAITDREQPNLERAYQICKQADNFEADGRELKKLSEMTSGILVNRGSNLKDNQWIGR